ncbi:hypothetical protein BVC80_8677g17 [Macleaya cordata]|uniref:WEB family n=1 Tax=Macleaya cordata TaxID=56857 RepID=A0A200Q0Y8_MACCD|nr:hypothetical protein BVC80_8677g17 [Macleaya cordata]
METQEPPSDDHEKTIVNNSILSSIDTSRPFRSVKEAVAIFDERLLAGVFFSSPKPFTTISNNQLETTPKPPLPPLFSPSSNSTPKQLPREDGTFAMKNTLKRLEVELEDTKRELSLLKERESETEIALASLNAELHKSMSKMAEAEAVAARAKAVVAKKGDQVIGGNYNKYGGEDNDICEEITSIMKMENYSSSLAEVLSLGEKEGYFEAKKKDQKKIKMTVKKKKPIIPLVGDLFSRKKSSSKSLYNPLYTSSFDHSYFN